jgi:hypothetical protein
MTSYVSECIKDFFYKSMHQLDGHCFEVWMLSSKVVGSLRFPLCLNEVKGRVNV